MQSKLVKPKLTLILYCVIFTLHTAQRNRSFACGLRIPPYSLYLASYTLYSD